MSGVAEKKKDAFKRLRTVTILLAVLAIACGALAFFSERRVQEDLVAQKAAVEQKNAELTAQHNQAVEEYNAGQQKVQDSIPRPQPAASGWDVLDLSAFPLSSGKEVTATRAEVLSGGMLLLNRWHSLPGDFPEGNIVSVNSVTRNIPVSGSSVKLFPVAINALEKMLSAAAEEGLENYLLEEGYRTMAAQTESYQKEAAKYENRYSGNALIDRVTQSVNYPGTSEYQSGLSFRITRWHKDDSAFNSEKFETTAHSDWLLEHSWEYGFVFRFPVLGYPNETVTDKSFKTGETKKLRIFRYVGIENAAVMHLKNFCMEEYVEYLIAHPHIAVYQDGALKYEIVRQEGGTTAEDVTVNVPQNAASVSVSSDNVGGIIIAVSY